MKYKNMLPEVLEGNAASVCVMDIYNGDIISLVSSPF